MTRALLLITLFVFTVITSAPAIADGNNGRRGRDGERGNSSTATSEITLEKASEVRISNLSDINFGSNVTSPDARHTDVCIYSSTGSYDVTASSGAGQGSKFYLSNGAGAKIEYDVEWNDEASGNSGQNLNHGQVSNEQSGANTSQHDCGGSVNARMFVEVKESSFRSAPADNYSDTLTLVVSPR